VCFAIAVAAGFAFVAVESRVAVPMLDLALLRNRVLVGATIAILIGAGTINGLMYLLSLYFQDPSTLGFSPLQAGSATLPATVGLVVIAPIVPRLAAKFGGRQVIGVGFAVTAAGFAAIGFVQPSWRYMAFLLPLIAIAEWACPTGRPPPRQLHQSRPRRSERHPAYRKWPAT
jgi:Na+/melibiose symporter-like transporter